jgi:hypothetical protein
VRQNFSAPIRFNTCLECLRGWSRTPHQPLIRQAGCSRAVIGHNCSNDPSSDSRLQQSLCLGLPVHALATLIFTTGMYHL